MTVQIAARSISRSVQEWLLGRRPAGRVVAVFEHACTFSTREGDVAALVMPAVGDGPLNIVVDAERGEFGKITPDEAMTLTDGTLRVGALQVSLAEATVWEPRPDWHSLRNRRKTIVAHLPLVWTTSLQHDSAGSLLQLVAGKDAASSPPWWSRTSPYASIFEEATEALRTGIEGDASGLQEGAALLAGLGIGLTPAGDDFLAGVMLWAWLAHTRPDAICDILVKVAAPRTTTLSAAFLRAAGKGECTSSWHRLLAALAEGAEPEIAHTVLKVLAHGATSGGDTLAGFLLMTSALSRHSERSEAE